MARKGGQSKKGAAADPKGGLTVVEIDGAPWVAAPWVAAPWAAAPVLWHAPILGPFPDHATAWRWIERNRDFTHEGAPQG